MTNLRRFLLGLCLLGSAPYATAEGGWYLLIPPASDYDEQADYGFAYKILDDRRLGRWSQYGAYDSASECEASKKNQLSREQGFSSVSESSYVNALEKPVEPEELKGLRFIAEGGIKTVKAFLASRCIKSDDLRLSK